MKKRTAVLAALAAALALQAAQAEAGVVVTAVEADLAAERAGLRPGDRLSSWEQGPDSGPLASPFDVAELDLERGPRGPVRLVGLRGVEPIAVSLFPDEWGLVTRPELPAEAVADLDAAQRADYDAWILLESARATLAQPRSVQSRLDRAGSALAEGIALARAAGRSVVEAQLLAFHGEALLEAGRLDDAVAPLEQALALREAMGGDRLAAASLALPIARVALGRAADPSGPRATVERLAARAERIAPDSLARVRAAVGLIALKPAAEQATLCGRALGIADRLAPDRLLTARLLVTCGWIDPDPLHEIPLLQRAASILERRAPESALRAHALVMLGSSFDVAGDSVQASAHHQRALALIERVDPGSSQHANVLNRIASYWGRHGDLVQAEALFRRALEVDESQAHESPGIVQKLYNIGEVLRRRRDFDQAEAQFTRALEVSRKRDPSSVLTGRLLHLLGRTALERGDPRAAEPFLRQALPILTVAEPIQVGHVRESLGQCLAQAGRLDEAEAIFRSNLEQALPQNAPYVLADRHQALGQLLRKRGVTDEARRNVQAALDLRRTLAPGSIGHAESAHELGLLARDGDRKEEARSLLEEAVAALETQSRRLGGSEETRTAFRAHYHGYYRDLEDLLLDLGREREAFEVMERSRARGLLSLIAGRDLDLGVQVPAALTQEQRQADLEHDRAFRALQRATGEARAPAERALEEARRKQEDVRARIRASAPRAAGLLDPQPLDLAGVRRALSDDTLLLAFSLGPAEGRVYAVGPGPEDFAVVPLGASAEGVQAEVRRFREVVHARRTGLERTAVVSASRRLGDRLLAGVTGPLARARRILIVPDGALHLVPFAALQDPTRAGRYLVESKSIEVAPSVTLYDTLTRAASSASGPVRAVGFGDPAYPPDATGAGPALTRAQAAGLTLSALPATRGEVEALRTLAQDALLWTGAGATEERAKAIPRGTRFVHFACHGFLDERLPLESGLALAVPAGGREAKDNGFLQAWEVLEGLRIDADQVTLSACQTGLGRDLAGEGLLGLTWAFLYAGARSVLASLWEVADTSTADLMKRLYRHLSAGVPRAEALRRAQVEMLGRRTTSSPYFWAAFTLIGDGRSPPAGATLAAP